MLNKIFTIILFTAVVFAIILAITMDATAQTTWTLNSSGRVTTLTKPGKHITIIDASGRGVCLVNCGDPNPMNLDPTFDYPNILNQNRFRRPGVRLVNPNLD